MADFSVQVDRDAYRKLEQVLVKLPERTRNARLIAAQRKAMKPVKAEVQRRAQQMTGSTTIGKGIEIQKGRYSRKSGLPYVVLIHGKYMVKTTRKLGRYTIPHTSDYSKISHLVIGGTRWQNKKAGTRTRTLRRKSGASTTQQYATQGTAFTVRGKGGQWMKVKKIHHGSEPRPYFDEGYAAAINQARDRFNRDVLNDVTRYAKRQGLL